MAANSIRLAHLATVGAILAATACGSSGSGGSSGYDDGVRQRFVSACAQSAPGHEAACEATYDCIKQRVPYADFESADEAIREGRDVEPRVAHVVAQCIAQSARG